MDSLAGRLRVFPQDCMEVLPRLKAGSVDAIVTDPPYGLSEHPPEVIAKALSAWLSGDRSHVPDGKGFMGKSWDKFVPPPAVWDECFRVLKPGGHMVVFGASRVYDLLVLSIRLAGFEIRDSLHWIYGSGFPKSLDVSKAIDKATAQQSGIDTKTQPVGRGDHVGTVDFGMKNRCVTCGKPFFSGSPCICPKVREHVTEDAARWDGWGTALKPAHEPIVVARKPLAGTVAANVLEHGTGALNIDGCRVAHVSEADRAESEGKNQHAGYGNTSDRLGTHGIYGGAGVSRPDYDGSAGRWPPNILLTHSADCQPAGARQVKTGTAVRSGGVKSGEVYSEWAKPEGTPDMTYGNGNGTETVEAWECVPGCPVAGLDQQSGELHSQDPRTRRSSKVSGGQIFDRPGMSARYADVGGASRFFPTFTWNELTDFPFLYQAKAARKERPSVEINGKPVSHPTVKPLALMQWLVRLVTPPDGAVFDPFAGTGTTGQACLNEGFRAILCEDKDDDAHPYVRLIRKRLESYGDWDVYGD